MTDEARLLAPEALVPPRVRALVGNDLALLQSLEAIEAVRWLLDASAAGDGFRGVHATFSLHGDDVTVSEVRCFGTAEAAVGVSWEVEALAGRVVDFCLDRLAAAGAVPWEGEGEVWIDLRGEGARAAAGPAAEVVLTDAEAAREQFLEPDCRLLVDDRVRAVLAKHRRQVRAAEQAAARVRSGGAPVSVALVAWPESDTWPAATDFGTAEGEVGLPDAGAMDGLCRVIAAVFRVVLEAPPPVPAEYQATAIFERAGRRARLSALLLSVSGSTGEAEPVMRRVALPAPTEAVHARLAVQAARALGPVLEGGDVAQATRRLEAAGLLAPRTSGLIDWLRLGRFLQQHAVLPGLAGAPATQLAVFDHDIARIELVEGMARPVRIAVGVDGLRRALDAGLPLAGLDGAGRVVGLVDARPTRDPAVWRVRVVPPAPHAGHQSHELPWRYATMPSGRTGVPSVHARLCEARAAGRRQAEAAF